MSNNTGNNALADEKHFYAPVEHLVSPLPPATPRRGSDESSASGSEYAPSLKEAAKTAVKTLDVYHTKARLNLRIKSTDGICHYYVDNSCFTPGKPDVNLLAGSEKTDPLVGVCRWSNMYSYHLTVGIGKPDDVNTVWEEVRTEHYRNPEYKWSIDLGSGKRRSFIWKRTHHLDPENSDANSWSNKNFKLLDGETGVVVAVFASNRFKSWKKLGKFTFKADYGKQWELMTIISALGLIEMSRRRGRQRRTGGTHGGG